MMPMHAMLRYAIDTALGEQAAAYCRLRRIATRLPWCALLFTLRYASAML